MGIFSLSWQMVGMWGIAILLLYLAVAKQYEPLLMVPIAFGALIANIPDNGMLITQLNQQVISSNEQGEVTSTSLNNVGYLRVHVAPLQQTPAKVPANLTTPEARAQYLETMQQPMQVYPGSQLTVSKIKSVRESQEKAKADAARLGDDSLTVDPNLKDFQNVTEDNGNEPVFLLTNGEGTTVVRQQGVNYFATSGNRVPVDLKTQKLEPLVVSAAGKYVAVGQHTQELLVTSIHGGLYDWIGLGIKAEIFPPIIFLGVGALTDFGPLLAAPRTLLLGAAAQVGVAATFFMALFMGFNPNEAASIGIIGGADGPTSIFLTMKLAPHLLGAVAVAAYTYMSLVPLIQPPIMALLTTKKERLIRMKSLRTVSKSEKLFFAVLVTIVTILLIPDASPLIGMLMLGNFLRECKVTERLVQASQNQHRHHLPGNLRGSHDAGRPLPAGGNAANHSAGHCRLRRSHCGRRHRRQAHEPHLAQESGQPPHRVRRRLRRPDGGPRLPQCGPEVRPLQLSAHARHGPERCRRDRHRSHRGLLHRHSGEITRIENYSRPRPVP